MLCTLCMWWKTWKIHLTRSSGLIRLHTRDIMDKSSADCVATIQARGQEQYMLFIQDRLTRQVKAISEPLPRNKVYLFNEPLQKSTTNVKGDIIMPKNEASLFSRLYISCQNMNNDLNNFFKHGNQPFSCSLSSYGQLRQGKKPDLMGCLELLRTPISANYCWFGLKQFWCLQYHIDGIEDDYSISVVNALETQQSFAKPSISTIKVA